MNPSNQGFDDLHIKPISFGAKAHELVNDVYWLYNAHSVSKRDTANNWLRFRLFLFKPEVPIPFEMSGNIYKQ